MFLHHSHVRLGDVSTKLPYDYTSTPHGHHQTILVCVLCITRPRHDLRTWNGKSRSVGVLTILGRKDGIFWREQMKPRRNDAKCRWLAVDDRMQQTLRESSATWPLTTRLQVTEPAGLQTSAQGSVIQQLSHPILRREFNIVDGPSQTAEMTAAKQGTIKAPSSCLIRLWRFVQNSQDVRCVRPRCVYVCIYVCMYNKPMYQFHTYQK